MKIETKEVCENIESQKSITDIEIELCQQTKDDICAILNVQDGISAKCDFSFDDSTKTIHLKKNNTVYILFEHTGFYDQSQTNIIAIFKNLKSCEEYLLKISKSGSSDSLFSIESHEVIE